MSVPYGRKSRTRSRIQRAANMRFTPKSFTNCVNCHEPKFSHYICGQCSYYNGRFFKKSNS